MLLPTICYHHPSKLLHPQPSKARMPRTDSVAIISSCTNALTRLEEQMHCCTFRAGLKKCTSPETTIKTSSRVEKCGGVEKQVSASGGRSSAWVIDCPNQPRGSRARPRLDLLRFKKWICLVGGSIFLSSIWIIDRWQRSGWQSKEPQEGLVGARDFS